MSSAFHWRQDHSSLGLHTNKNSIRIKKTCTYYVNMATKETQKNVGL
jgi:hypothetical protein